MFRGDFSKIFGIFSEWKGLVPFSKKKAQKNRDISPEYLRDKPKTQVAKFNRLYGAQQHEHARDGNDRLRSHLESLVQSQSYGR